MAPLLKSSANGQKKAKRVNKLLELISNRAPVFISILSVPASSDGTIIVTKTRATKIKQTCVGFDL